MIKELFLQFSKFSKKNYNVFALFFLVIFVIIFYIQPLGKYVFSPDEIFITKIAKEGISGILTYHKTNIDPPLERIILYPFTKIDFIQREFILRFPYLLFSLMTLYLVYLFTKKITENKTYGILASLLCAGIFYFFRYSQEVRYYHIYSFFFLLSNYIFLDLLFYKTAVTKKDWVKLLAVNAISFYFNIFALFNVAIQSLILIFLFLAKKTSIKKVAYFSYLGLFIASIVPWVIYNEKIKIVFYSLFSLQHPNASILGGIDWLQPRENISYFEFFLRTSRNIFIDHASLILVIVLIIFSIVVISKKYRPIFSFLIFSIFGNYALFLFATMYLIPGVISDPGSTERRLIFILPLLSIIFILALYSLRKTRKAIVFFVLVLIFWSLQVSHLYRWIANPYPQNFLLGVDYKKNFLGIRDVMVFIENQKYDDVVLLNAYQTGDAVASYYFNENKINYQWILPEQAENTGGKVLIVSYENIGIEAVPFNKNLKKVEKFGNYELYEIVQN